MRNRVYREILDSTINKQKEAEKGIGEETAEEAPKNNDIIFEEEEDKIRITMLGTTSSGKTAFLSGVYQTLISDPHTDIYLEINKEYDENELYASIKRIAMLREDGTVNPFPAGTKETKIYGLILSGGRNQYCPFEFMDYRGALVSQVIPGEKADNGDVEIFRKQIIKSDVILVFADAVLISQYQDVKERRAKCQASMINHIFSAVLKGYENSYHVILVLTKMDDSYVRPEDKANNCRKLCKKALEIFEPVRQKSASFAIVPVSAVGEGNTITYEQKDSAGETIWVSKLKENAIPEPENIDVVMMYACRRILESRLETWEKDLEEMNRMYQEMENERNHLPRLAAFFQRGADLERMAELNDEIVKKVEMIQTLRENIRHMSMVYHDKFRMYVYQGEKELFDDL